MSKHKHPIEPTPWPQYLAEKEQEILALRKLVREAAEMLEHVHQYGEDARISAYEIEAWMNRKWEVLPEHLEVGGKEDEETQIGESQG